MGRRKAGEGYQTGIAVIPTRDETKFSKHQLRDLIKDELALMIPNDMTESNVDLDGSLEGSLFFDQREGKSRKEVLPRVNTAITNFVSKIHKNRERKAAEAAAVGA